ncbi:MAG TPA: flagellar basal body-associated protein FliL [Verrucomicrobiae bacterium]|jgi:hypothetical protein|nr:flagellar basal body-associated protein FliL [Verrucomicrobiae bacterium]
MNHERLRLNARLGTSFKKARLLRAVRFAALLLLVLTACRSATADDAPGLRDATVLIIRHAEKPENGSDLSPEGVERAKAYVHYFYTFQLDGEPLKIDSLFAAADSKKSTRPRLTLEPLSRALNLPLNTAFKDKEPEALARELESRPHGTNILICWHHQEIPELLRAMGADPDKLLHHGKWPGHVYGWVIELRYDHEGRLKSDDCKRIKEHLRPGDEE